MIQAADIKPEKKGLSDFFSWQLYRWVRKFPYRLTVWKGTWNPFTGCDPLSPYLYIGDPRDGQWIHGRALRNLCVVDSKIEAYAYGPAHDTDNWTDVTEKFWRDYLRIGVCAIHPQGAHDWDAGDGVRTCRRCYQQERQVTKKVERRIWVPMNAHIPA